MKKKKKKKKTAAKKQSVKQSDLRSDIESLNDEDLMLLCQKGELLPFEVLYERYSKRIMNYIYGLVNDYRQTENLTQEVFLRIFKYAETYKHPQKFSTWLFALARNLCRSYMRKTMKKSGKVSLDKIDYNRFEKPEDAADTPHSRIENAEHREQIRRAVAELPAIYREVIFLYFFDNFSYNEISEIVGLGQSTLRSRMYYGLRKLKKSIERMK